MLTMFKVQKDDFLISTDKSKLQIDVIHDYLANRSYWAKGIPVEIVQRSFVLEEYRGNGLSKFLVESVLKHPDLQGLRRWVLATWDAHGLYAQFGFEPLDKPEHFMQIKTGNPYGV